MTSGAGVLAGARILVLTVVHDPADARIRYRQIPALLRAGAEVTYAAPFTAYGREVPDGVRGLDVPRARGKRRLTALRGARRLLRAERAHQDLVLLHDPELLLALPGTVPKGKRGTAPVVVWDVHENTGGALATKDWLPAPLRRLAAFGVHRAERWAENRCELILAEYGYAPLFAREHPVVPNSTVVPDAEPSPPEDERVVYLGRINRSRGGLEMVALARALDGTVKVQLIGPADADVAGEIERAAADGVLEHAGFVPNAEALARLDGALAGLSLLHDHPNHAVSRPTKLMEYMAHGVPVITTENRDSKAFVERYECGVVVPFGDVAAAADAVRTLKADGELRRAMGAAGRKAAVEEFDWRRDGEDFTRVLAGWIRRRSGRIS